MKACLQIAECSFSSTKKMQTSAMKACFQIAECSFSSAKISNILVTSKYLAVFLAFSFVFSREKINFVSNGVIRLEKDVRK